MVRDLYKLKEPDQKHAAKVHHKVAAFIPKLLEVWTYIVGLCFAIKFEYVNNLVLYVNWIECDDFEDCCEENLRVCWYDDVD